MTALAYDSDYQGAPYPPVNGTEPCRQDPDRWFPPNNSKSATKPAKDFCNGTDEVWPCRVREQCLAYALTHDVRGVWGGSDDIERDKLREKQSIRVVPMVTVLDRGLIANAHRRGMSNAQIAAVANVTVGAVERILREQYRETRAKKRAKRRAREMAAS